MDMANKREPVPESKIVELEKAWGFVLPEQYRSFLIEHNGGRPVLDEFDWNDGKNGSMVQYFLGLNVESYEDLEQKRKVFNDRIPSDLLGIGSDPCGNLICIGVSGENTGKVFFWHHEFEVEEGETPDYSNVTFLANSFDEFADSLYQED